MENILIHIKASAPIAYIELEEFVNKKLSACFSQQNIVFHLLPNALLVGIFLDYFNAQSIEFSIGDCDIENIMTSILETFVDYEKVISHYS